MKRGLILIGMLALVLTGCNQNSGGSAGSSNNFKLDNEQDKTFYAMGYMLGMNLQRLELNDREIQAIFKGVENSAKNVKSEVDMNNYQPKIQTIFKERMEKVAKKQESSGKKFLEDFLKKPNVKKTESGLAYEIIEAGKGATPKATDTVEVHYHGTLITGEVFDSSKDRGQTIKFPLNRVIKGWTEGLQLIKEGGKVKLVIPPELGYGKAGAPPKIPGNATLVFEVELFKIVKEDAKKDAHAGHDHGAEKKPAAKKAAAK
ncbi:FKBP-type peptidyl-prolyl cis-trans isomerase [Bacteriovoracaceae bacterium]|nr:FKBP-type peptidyl-prolyl cis-trans isomerase [Bacteriovoracaceae bacterium]